ncbi:MAG: response regulator [Thermoplasmata archaeon]|nr:response regulator [Thermoplasmata archaeon]
MLKGKGKFNVYGSKAIISVPSVIWRDSQYPFKKGEEVEIEILGEELRIKKLIKKEQTERKIILLVDDEPEVHELMRQYLIPFNIELYSAQNGMEAVRIYRELFLNGKRPQLVIMDLNLSRSRKDEDLIKQMRGEEMDGVKVASEIKKIDPKANIIGFSAFAHFEWGERLLEAGAKKIFGKEIGFENFAKKIHEFVAR